MDDFLCISFLVVFTPVCRVFRTGKVLQEDLPGAKRNECPSDALRLDHSTLNMKGIVPVSTVDAAVEQRQIPDGVIRFSGSGICNGIDMLQIPVEPGTAVQLQGKPTAGIGSLQTGEIIQQKNSLC